MGCTLNLESLKGYGPRSTNFAEAGEACVQSWGDKINLAATGR